MPVTLPSPESQASYPRRIVCLSDETTEVLYMLGAQDCIVGISGFSNRPLEARLKPRISAFRDADFEAILALEPDLVLTFSDVQAEISRQLVLRGLPVLNFNQRSLAEIFEMIGMLSRIVGKPAEGQALIKTLHEGLEEISGICWVDELIEIAGGNPIFPELRRCGKSKDRVVDPGAVVVRDPEVILASWCGMKVDIGRMIARPGWSQISAVRNCNLTEINSSIILQPGPAALTDGVRQIHQIIAQVATA